MADLAGAAEFILSEFIQCTDRFQGRGQGWSGYLLTYGRALMDLRLLGYADLSSRAEAGYKIYIRRIRMGPQESDKVRAEHLPTHLSPLQAAYWQDRDGDLFLGHQLKYPYGFYGIMDKVDDPDLKRRALAIAYRIF